MTSPEKAYECFWCDTPATFWLKNFWLGTSYIPSAAACDYHKEEITKSVRTIITIPLSPCCGARDTDSGCCPH